MNDGVISCSLMEIVGLNVGSYVMGEWFGDDEIRINYAAADLNITNGLASSRLFVFDTENAVINIIGTTNFANERMELSINPESKGFVLSLCVHHCMCVAPLKNPDAGVRRVRC
ncbi:hypothetical protein ETR_13906 [Erwinia tracheiphila PSU-1]|nr:hypothetical protein ETR_13906 [Erwinia tracheiphila PSU-1]